MSDETPRLKLAQLVSLQELNAVTWNEALARLDALVDLTLLARNANTPPASPQDGDAYLVGASPSGAWTGYAGSIACCSDGAWQFVTPFPGMLAYLPSGPDLLIYTGSSWAGLASVLALQNLPTLGINCAADTGNKLAVSSPAVLFNHAGNGVQLKLNKNASGDTASVLYQTNWSGRAEFGTCGDDHFRLKVSPDGANWIDVLDINNTTGGLSHADGTIPRTLSVQNSGDVNDSASGSGTYHVHTLAFTLPANFLRAGRVLRVTAAFRLVTGSAPPVLHIQLRAGATVIAQHNPAAPTALQTNVQQSWGWIVQAVDPPGTAAAIECAPAINNSNGPANTAITNVVAMPVQAATSGALTLCLATQWDNAGTGVNQIKLSQLLIEALN
jgi:hypothetical protein